MKKFISFILGCVLAIGLQAQVANTGHAASVGSVNAAPVSPGDVVGPASSTNNAFARFSGTTGKLLQDTPDLTYSSPTLSVPDAFVVSSAGSIGLTAGGAAKNIPLAPSTTGFVTITKSNGSPQLYLMATGVAAPQTASLDFRSTGDNSLAIITNYTGGTTNQINMQPGTTQTARFLQSGSVLIGSILDNGSRLTLGRTASATATLATGYLSLGSSENLINSYRLMWLGYNLPGTTTYAPAYFGYQEMANNGSTQGDLVWGVRGVTTDTQPVETMRLKSTGLIINGTSTLSFGATALANIGVSADTTGGILQLKSPTSGTMTFTTANALSATLSGGAAATLTGGAGNMTITAGTGASRTLTLQTTTSGSTATDAVVIGAAQTFTKINGLTTAGLGVPTIVAQANITAQSAAATITSYANPATDADFEVSCQLNVSAATSLSAPFQCTYTDVNNVAKTLTFAVQDVDGTGGTYLVNGLMVAAAAKTFMTPVMHIRAKASTTITLKTGTGTYTGVTYSASGIIKKLD